MAAQFRQSSSIFSVFTCFGCQLFSSVYIFLDIILKFVSFFLFVVPVVSLIFLFPQQRSNVWLSNFFPRRLPTNSWAEFVTQIHSKFYPFFAKNAVWLHSLFPFSQVPLPSFLHFLSIRLFLPPTVCSHVQLFESYSYYIYFRWPSLSFCRPTFAASYRIFFDTG